MTGVLDAREDGPSIGEMLVHALQRYPERTAFVSDGRPISYAALSADIGRLQRHLDALGLRPGDSIAQLSRNCVEQFVAVAACYLGGYRSVTLQPLLHPVDVQARLLAACDPALLLFDEAFADRAGQLRGALPAVRHWRCQQSGRPDAPCLWDELAALPAAPPENRVSPETVVRIGFTSGTTEGEPKGVLLSSRALGALTLANLADGDWPATPRVLCAEAIAGGFGNMIVPTLMRGGTFILSTAQDAGQWLREAAEHRADTSFLMPWSLQRLVDHPDSPAFDWSRFELIGYSGATLGDTTMAAALALFGPILSQIYGQTEFPKALTILSKADHASGDPGRLRSLGLPYSGTSAVLLDPEGRPVPDGDIGELCVLGAPRFSGYLGDPERSAHATRDGYHHTGDLCRRDAQGYVHFVDRVEDLIATEDGSACPSEIEARLRSLPGVIDAAALGFRDAAGLRRIGAFVAVDGDVPDAAMIEAAFADRPDLRPARLLPCPEVPRGLIGRIDRRRLASLWAEKAHMEVAFADRCG